jgi:hypothetical protein
MESSHESWRKENMYPLTKDGKKQNARSSYKILPWVGARHPWEVQISAFAY